MEVERSSVSDNDVESRVRGLETAQATQAATLAGAQATQAAAQAGTTATNAAMQAGTMATMAAGSVGFIVGIFLGMAIARVRS
jgi:hypothetical protein